MIKDVIFGMQVVLTLLSLGGVVLNVMRRREGFLLWIVANVGWTAVDYQAGLGPQALLFAAYTTLAMWGYVAWGKR